MTAAASIASAARPDPLAVFVARCEARALLCRELLAPPAQERLE